MLLSKNSFCRNLCCLYSIRDFAKLDHGVMVLMPFKLTANIWNIADLSSQFFLLSFLAKAIDPRYIGEDSERFGRHRRV